MGYLTSHYKSVYRILPVIDKSTNDFARDCDGKIDDDNVYITCYYDVKIWHYGKSRLMVYVPTIQRGRNFIKALNKLGVEIFDCDESDEEVTFKFNATDIEKVASVVKPKTNGAKTSPFSVKNLPKEKVDIPEEEMAKYKTLVSKLGTRGMSVVRTANTGFLDNILAKKLRPPKKRKPFDYKADQKKLGLLRDTKGYIYSKNLWNEYLDYLEKEIDSYYNK